MTHLALAAPAAAALDDREVVVRVVGGEAPLFEILMRRYNQRLFRIARGILGNDGEAEDAVQEAWVSAFRNLAGYRGEASVATWLTRIAVHDALARLRRRRRLVAVGDATAEPPTADAGDDPERRMENHELQRLLEAAVDRLPAPLRAVLVLREIEGLSSDETAEALAISAANVRVRLHRAKAALRDDLDTRIGRETRRLWLFAGDRCDRVVAGVFARLGLS